jgi:hypothetical protein
MITEPKQETKKEIKQEESKGLTATEVMTAAAYHLEQARMHTIRFLELSSLI